MKLEKILSRVMKDPFSLDQDSIKFCGKSFPRKNNFIDLTSGSISKEQEKISIGFGNEWMSYNKILEEYNSEFENYFDVVPKQIFSKQLLVGDLGCGNGRWSYEFLKRNKESFLILVDISDSIHVAQKNLESFKDRTLFIKSDVTKLPFKENSLDFFFSLGVVHHIPGTLLDNLDSICCLSEEYLLYLYYSLDNRNIIFKYLFKLINLFRILLSKISSELIKKVFCKLILFLVYLPLIGVSRFCKLIGLEASSIPLSYYASNYSLLRIEQDVYDRFFTSIENRISAREIEDHFSKKDLKVSISKQEPYWHFFVKNK